MSRYIITWSIGDTEMEVSAPTMHEAIEMERLLSAEDWTEEELESFRKDFNKEIRRRGV